MMGAMSTPHTPPGPDYHLQALDDGLVFTICRPQRLNALTRPVLDGLGAAIDQLEAEGKPLLIIVGEGEKAFCAGTDLAELSTLDAAQSEAKTLMARQLLVRLWRSRLISVAAINGLAYGGGLELAMACTFRVAAAHARLSLPEIKLGVLPAYGGTQFLPALVGRARALEMMLVGEPVDAQQALAMGLVHRVITPEPGSAQRQSCEAALAMARSVTRFSPLAIDAIRQCVDAAGEQLGDAGLRVEDEQVRRVFVSEDAREGVAAFLEKRTAVFRGR